MVQYFPVVTGSLTVTGSVLVSGGITASGGISISGSIASSSFASTASFVALAQSASNAVAAATASFANVFTVAGNLTAQTLVVQTITSSVSIITGSTNFGTLSSNTHTFTGSINASGSSATFLGNVGVGAAAGEKFAVTGPTGSQGFIRWTDGVTTSAFLGLSGTTAFIHANNNALGLGANGSNNFSPTMTLTNGRVGIGTINPSTYALEVNGAVSATSGFIGNASTATQPKSLYYTSGNFTSGTTGGTEDINLTGYYLPYMTPIMFNINLSWNGNGSIQNNYIGFAQAVYWTAGTATIIWTANGISGGAGYPSLSVSVQGGSYNTRYLRITLTAEVNQRPNQWSYWVNYWYPTP